MESSRRTRVVYPAKILESKNLNGMRATLTRWEYYHGQTPTFAIGIWEGALNLLREEFVGERNAFLRWAEIDTVMAVAVARKALGLTQKIDPETSSWG